MAMPQALIFDVDGTLADTEGEGHRVAFNQAFADAGLDWHWSSELYGELLAVTGGKERMHHFIRHYLSPGDRPADADTLVPRLHQEKNRRYEALLQGGRIGLRPGVERLLREAREAGLILAIATTTTRSNVLALLKNTLGEAATAWFRVIATADEVSEKKPSPKVYEYVLEVLGLTSAQCLVFEDSENGLRAARAIGLETLVTVNDYTRDGDYGEALLVVEHLGEPGRPAAVLGGQARARLDAPRCVVDLDLLQRLWE